MKIIYLLGVLKRLFAQICGLAVLTSSYSFFEVLTNEPFLSTSLVWFAVNFRGDQRGLRYRLTTPLKDRVQYDVYFIL